MRRVRVAPSERACHYSLVASVRRGDVPAGSCPFSSSLCYVRLHAALGESGLSTPKTRKHSSNNSHTSRRMDSSQCAHVMRSPRSQTRLRFWRCPCCFSKVPLSSLLVDATTFEDDPTYLPPWGTPVRHEMHLGELSAHHRDLSTSILIHNLASLSIGVLFDPVSLLLDASPSQVLRRSRCLLSGSNKRSS